MNLKEAVEEHGPIVAVDPGSDILVCWDEAENVFTVLTGNTNYDYTVTEQYDGDGDPEKMSLQDAESEAWEILDDMLGDGDDKTE